jgi:tape measure domain-containing protein
MSDALIISVDSSQVEKGKRSLADLAAQGKKTEQAIGGLGASGNKSASALSGMASSAKVAALGLAGVGVSLAAIGAAVLNTGISFEKLNNTLKFSTGSAIGAAKELEYLKTTSNKLGLEFLSTAQAYSKFSAAAKGTTLEGQKTRDIFESIAKASTVLGLSADETGGALKAIEQIISKGTVSSEELRGQLGERLPGAFQIAARAMGVTTAELGKMLEQGQVVSDVFLPKFAAELTKTLGDSPDSAASSAQAKLNKLSNAWLDFKKAIAESGVVSIVLKVVEGSTNALQWFEHFVFNKGELANINKRISKQTDLNNLQTRVNNRKPETSLFETDSTKQARLNVFNAQQAKDKAQIRRLQLSLGIIDGKDTQPATGNILDSLNAPNFGTIKKDGQGGYDTRVNNQKQIEDARKAASSFNNSKQKADQLRQHKEENENRLYSLQRELEKDIEERETKHQKLVRENNERRAKDKEALENKQYALSNDLEKNLEEREIKHLKLVREIKEDAAKEQLKAQQELAKDLNKSLTDALLRGFESGKGFAKNFRDTLINMFKTLILQPTISAILKPVTDSVSGILSNALNAGGGASSGSGILGSASNLLSVGKSIYSGFSSALSSNIGGLVANFAPQLGSSIAGSMLGTAAGLGPTVAGSATGIGALTGSIGSLGSAISTALPYVGLAITAFSVVKSLFGKKKVPRFSSQITSTYADGVFSQANGKQFYKPLGDEKQLGGLSEKFSRTLGGFLKGFGLNDGISTTADLLKKRKASYGVFSASFDGGSVSASTTGKAKNVQDTFARLVETVLGSTLVEAIQKTKVADGIKALFNGLTDKTQVVNMINASTTLQEAQKELADKYGLTVDLAGKVAVASGNAGDALAEFVKSLSSVALSGRSLGTQLINNKDKLFGDFNTVFGDVITEAVLSTVSRQVEIPATTTARNRTILGGSSGEFSLDSRSPIASVIKQYQTVTEQVTTFVDRIVSRGLKLPRTIADYDTLLKNIDKTTVAGQAMFADVFALRDEFVAGINAENGLKGNLRGGLASIVSDAEKQKLLQEDIAALFGNLNLKVPATIQDLIKSGQDALAQLNLGTATAATYDLAAAFPTLVSAFKEAKDGIDSLANSLRDESGFKTLYDYNFYKGIASNYGNEFANRFTNGDTPTYGESNNTSVAFSPVVTPQNNTTISTSDPNMLNAISTLIARVDKLQVALDATQANTKSSAQTLVNVTGNGGDAIQTVVAV